jgi:hypothetical protein
MPSIKQRVGPWSEPARRGGDYDVTPETGPPQAETGVILPRGQPDKWTAGRIERFIDQWVEAETKRKGKKPSLATINRFRDKFTERFQEAVPEVEPTPEVEDIITPTTRIRGA